MSMDGACNSSSRVDVTAAVLKSALPTPLEWQKQNISKSIVALTTMNLHGMMNLFATFILSVERSNFSQHLLVVAYGSDAYSYCMNLTLHHKHQCLMDAMCPPNSHSHSHQSHQHNTSFTWGSYMHWLSMMRRIEWARHIIDLNVSVFWIEMDIFFFHNPFDFFFSSLPVDADAVVQSEYWDSHSAFKGDFCRINHTVDGCRDRGCADVTCSEDFQPNFKPGRENLMTCCNSPIPNVNGGECLVHPTEGGRLLMDLWYKLVYQNYVIEGRMWNGTARMDQSLLWVVLNDPGVRSNGIRALMASMHRFQSAFGPCGMMGNNIPFDSYVKDGRKVCVMPRKSAGRMISYHKTGGDKEAVLASWINWTVDEERYEEESKTMGDAFHPQRKVPRLVFPDW